MLQLAVFAVLVSTAGVLCWFVRGATAPLVFAVLFATDGAYQTMTFARGPHAALSALAAIAFCGLAWALDRVSPEA